MSVYGVKQVVLSNIYPLFPFPVTLPFSSFMRNEDKSMAGFKVHSIFKVHWAMAKALHLSINQNETYPQVLVLLIHL